jgi:hypothetical protein
MIERIEIIKEDKNKIIIKNKENKVKIVKGDVFDLNKRKEVDDFEDKMWNMIKQNQGEFINDDLLVGGNGDETIV